MPVLILEKEQQKSYQWMEHRQVLALKVAGLWSEIHNDMIHQEQSDPVIKKVKEFTSTSTFLTVLLLLALGGGIRCRPCLLSTARLERLGSVVAYLSISWRRVVDLNPSAEIGPSAL
jgi:hypothetical protein